MYSIVDFKSLLKELGFVLTFFFFFILTFGLKFSHFFVLDYRFGHIVDLTSITSILFLKDKASISTARTIYVCIPCKHT